MNMDTVTAVGFKIILSFFAIALALGFAIPISEFLFGNRYSGASTSNLLLVVALVSIWFPAPWLWRLFSAVGGLIVGLGVKLLAVPLKAFVPFGMETTATLIGLAHASSFLVALILCVSILVIGRRRARRSAEGSVETSQRS